MSRRSSGTLTTAIVALVGVAVRRQVTRRERLQQRCLAGRCEADECYVHMRSILTDEGIRSLQAMGQVIEPGHPALEVEDADPFGPEGDAHHLWDPGQRLRRR